MWEEGRCIDLLDSDLLFSLMVSSWLCNKHLVVLKVSLIMYVQITIAIPFIVYKSNIVFLVLG